MGWLTLFWVVLIGFFTVQWVAFDWVSWRPALAIALVDWAPWVVLSPIVLWFAGRVHVDGRNWKWAVPVHVLAGVGVAVGLEATAGLAFSSGWMPAPDRVFRAPARTGPENSAEFRPGPPPPDGGGGLGGGRGFGRGGRGWFFRARLALPIYLVLVAAAHAVSYHRRSLERERRALAAEAKLVSARLMALQNQLHPHFLFNTLNAVSALIHTYPKAADEMVCALSELLRSILAVSERKDMPLAEELRFIDRYLRIQQTRFNDKLSVRFEIDKAVEAALVPTLILQPLVENAVIHGITPRSEHGQVTVRALQKYGRLFLWVSDNGSGGRNGTKNSDDSLRFHEGLGLRNTRARLTALYGHDFRFFFKPSDQGGVSAFLDLPLRFAPLNENQDTDRR